MILISIGGSLFLAYAATSGTAKLSPRDDSAPNICSVTNQKRKKENIGPYDNYPSMENLTGGERGKLDNGNLFFLRPQAEYDDGLWVQVELVNRGEFYEKYENFKENISIYQANTNNSDLWTNSESWTQLANKIELLTMEGSPVTFQIPEQYVDHDYPLVVTLENGKYQTKENFDSYPGPIHYLSVDEADY